MTKQEEEEALYRISKLDYNKRLNLAKEWQQRNKKK